MPDGDQPILTCAHAMLDAHRELAQVDPKHLVELHRMERCLLNWRGYKGLQDTEHRHAFWQRCRSLFCAPCMMARHKEGAENILERTETAQTGNGSLAPIFITFKAPTYPLADAQKCTSEAIAQWSRFKSRKRFRHVVRGYARGVELFVDHSNDAVHAEISMLALVSGESSVEDQGGWLKLWNGTGKGEPSQKLVYAAPTFSKHKGQNDFVNHLHRVATVGVRPSRLCERRASGVVCDARKLKMLRTALRRRRLVQFGGLMRC